jgi:vancomycin resistance protein YoaR
MSKKFKITLTLLSSALILLLAIFLIWYLVWLNSASGYLPNKTYLGAMDVSGHSKKSVEDLLSKKEADLRNEGISFQNNEEVIIFPLNLSGLSPDIPGADLKYADSIEINSEKTIENLFNKQNGGFINHVVYKLFNKTRSEQIYYSYDLDTVNEWLSNNFTSLIIPPESAYFSLEEVGGEKKLINHQEKIGKEINLNEIEKDLNIILSSLENRVITIKTKSSYPLVKKEDIEPLRGMILELSPESGFDIYFNDIESEKGDLTIPQEIIVTWISVDGLSGALNLSFDLEKISEYIEKTASPEINEDVVLPKFEIHNNKVSNWQPGKNGKAVNLQASAQKIKNSLLNYESSATLIIDIINVDDLDVENDFKIKELIGTGYSNFAGSPANRRHNIKIGADALNGLLIRPNEEFSLVKYLGDIDAASGYLPELVIKDGRTIPEYGGGLCQVATSIFRSAMGTGLPITARRNHSYRVSYYEPAGMDASIYDPWPDVRFINDTNNYVLIQSRIEGNDLHFDFWGTSDGRSATTTKPVIFNIVKPPATKFIETDELKPGEKKCTERAHNGADAYFDYIVVYPEGATTTPRQEVRFKSHYVPWQEVCLIGKSIEEPVKDESVTEEVFENENTNNVVEEVMDIN